MEGTESSVAKMFVSLDDDEAYAGTSYSEWQLMAQQTKFFTPVKVEDLDPEHGDCEICFEPLGPSEEPVRLLSCGHVFGHVCIFHWLARFMPCGQWWDWVPEDAYFPYGSEEVFRAQDAAEFQVATMHTIVDDMSIACQEDGQLRPDWRDYLNWISDDIEDLMPLSAPRFSPEVRHASCPKCRGRFPIPRSGVLGVRIEVHLRFWDRMYEKLGISRSAKEEQCRNDLLRYVQMVQVPRIEIKPEHMRSWTLQAQVSAMRFALRRGNRDLDPLQTHLRDSIFNLGCYGLHEGEYHALAYENRRIPMWCFHVDRIERGLSPIIATVKHWARDRYDWALMQYSREFYREWRKQISGPWRRTLFAEVGGDRDGLRWKPPWTHYDPGSSILELHFDSDSSSDSTYSGSWDGNS